MRSHDVSTTDPDRNAIWNTNKQAALTHLTLRARGEYDVIALAEPHIDPNTSSPAAPGTSSYNLVYSPGRIALYIHKRHGPESWQARSTLLFPNESYY
jgi:hypothetical protein